MREIGLTILLIIAFLFFGLFYLVRGESLAGIGWLIMSLTGVAALGFVIWKQQTKRDYSEIPALIRYTATLGPLGIGLLLFIISSVSPQLFTPLNCLGDCRGADLSGVNLEEVDLRGYDFTEANLSGANLRNADLSGTILTQANLRDSDLAGAYLIEADLSEANLTGAKLVGVVLCAANLREATLAEVDFAGAINLKAPDNCEKADLRGADLRGVDLETLQRHVIIDDSTKLDDQ